MVKVARTPLHLHWELYKGSSIYELTEWWAKTHNPFGEKLWSMILDILSLREFYRRNRRFWYPLFIFHVGLYLLILWHLWLFIGAVVASAETASSFGWVWGTCATALTFIGGAMILWMRVTDKELKGLLSTYPLCKMGIPACSRCWGESMQWISISSRVCQLS